MRDAHEARIGTGYCAGEWCRRSATDVNEHCRVAAGQRLCRRCHGRLTTGLRELVRLYADCEGTLGGAPAGGVRQRMTGGSLPGIPLNGAGVEARANILAVLRSWSALVAKERRLCVPGRTVGPLAAFLMRNSRWLASHPAAGKATADVARAVRGARRVARPDAVRRIAIGRCVVPECDGELAATVHDTERRARAEIRCDTDTGHVWPAHQWTRLRRELQGCAGGDTAPETVRTVPQRWLTAKDISRLWAVPVGTVYRLASEQQWRRHSRAGRTHYAESDAHDCFRRRAVGTSRTT